MCDNCRTSQQIGSRDSTDWACEIINLLKTAAMTKVQITVKMIVDLLKGRDIKSAYFKGDIFKEFKGRLKSVSENDLRRLIIKLLQCGALEEQFVSTKAMGGHSNVSVYIGLGKPKYYDRIESNLIPIMLSCNIKDSKPSNFVAAKE